MMRDAFENMTEYRKMQARIAELERVAIIVAESGCTEDCIRNTYEKIEGCICGRDELAALLGGGE
jgi:hypothetical protein